jgi:hypothetical protein
MALSAWKPPQASTTASAGSVSRVAFCSTFTPLIRPSSVISPSAAQSWRKITPAARAARVSAATIAGPPPDGWIRGGPFAK